MLYLNNDKTVKNYADDALILFQQQNSSEPPVKMVDDLLIV